MPQVSLLPAWNCGPSFARPACWLLLQLREVDSCVSRLRSCCRDPMWFSVVGRAEPVVSFLRGCWDAGVLVLTDL